jgi:hypothetical protein
MRWNPNGRSRALFYAWLCLILCFLAGCEITPGYTAAESWYEGPYFPWYGPGPVYEWGPGVHEKEHGRWYGGWHGGWHEPGHEGGRVGGFERGHIGGHEGDHVGGAGSHIGGRISGRLSMCLTCNGRAAAGSQVL